MTAIRNSQCTRQILFAIWVLVAVPLSGMIGFVVLVFTSHYTANAAIYVSTGAVAAFALCVLLIAAVRRLLDLRRPVRWGAGVGLVLVLAPALAIVALNLLDTLNDRELASASAEVVADLGRFSHELDTIRAGADRADLSPLGAAFGSRRVVALGEATHGTAEFFLLKHRIVEYLVEDLGFLNFAMETSPEVGERLNGFIQGDDSDPTQVLYWPWATGEYLQMLEWMRRYNSVKPEQERIQFYGIDPIVGERDELMARNAIAILQQERPGEAKLIIWAANSHVRGTLGGMGEHLRRELGADIYLLGLEFHEGLFASRFSSVHAFQAGPFPPAYYSHAIAQLPGSVRYLDVASASSSATVQSWLMEPRTTNHLFESYVLTRLFRSALRVRNPLPDLFDGMVFIRESTLPTPLPTIDSTSVRFSAAGPVPRGAYVSPGAETARQ